MFLFICIDADCILKAVLFLGFILVIQVLYNAFMTRAYIEDDCLTYVTAGFFFYSNTENDLKRDY